MGLGKLTAFRPAAIEAAPGNVRVFGVGIVTDTASYDELELRRRALRYRAWHRGTREMDLVLGRFADTQAATLSADELAQLEALLQVPDPDLFGWILGRGLVPPEHDTAVFRRLLEFHRAGQGAGTE
jgi:antitoxin CptB